MDCNVKALCIESKQLDFAFNAFDGLDKVEELSLLDLDFSEYYPVVKHYTFGALRGCSNLKKLRIQGYLTPETTKQLVETLTSMPNVKTLSFAGHAPLSLVQDLQAIPSLSLVQVALYGDDLRCVWTFLFCLLICLAWVWLGFGVAQLLKA